MDILAGADHLCRTGGAGGAYRLRDLRAWLRTEGAGVCDLCAGDQSPYVEPAPACAPVLRRGRDDARSEPRLRRPVL